MKTHIGKNIDIGWNFDNTYINLPDIFYSKQEPVPVKCPKLIVLNKSLANILGLDAPALESNEAVDIFAGSALVKGWSPIAQAYAGHQFGHFTMLGDGRAILLGEHITPANARVDIQLKGSGRTKYSRGGDGRATLGPMLREYIISEAMNSLGIPTTRSLAVVTTGEDIIRERPLPGAVLTRVASSHIRVGTFQYAWAYGTNDDLKLLADYAIERHFPHLKSDKNKYLLLIKEVVEKQAKLIAKWNLVGFIHGVMNTDNMTISGETIDYGPCAFIDNYDSSKVFSSIDRNGRYAYGNQPKIAIWNLSRFAETLLPLINDDEKQSIKLATNEVSKFSKFYSKYWSNGMRQKLGLIGNEEDDIDLIKDLLTIMEKYNADYTNTFRELTLGKLSEVDLFKSNEFQQWNTNWQKRLTNQQIPESEIIQLMKANNPSVIPRNHRVEEALSAAEEGDLSVMDSLLNVLETPFEYSNEQAKYSQPPPKSKEPYKTFCGT